MLIYVLTYLVLLSYIPLSHTFLFRPVSGACDLTVTYTRLQVSILYLLQYDCYLHQTTAVLRAWFICIHPVTSDKLYSPGAHSSGYGPWSPVGLISILRLIPLVTLWMHLYLWCIIIFKTFHPQLHLGCLIYFWITFGISLFDFLPICSIVS